MLALEKVLDFIKTGQNEALENALREIPALADEKTGEISLLQFAAYCRNNTAVEILRQHRPDLDVFEAASIGEAELVRAFTEDDPHLYNSFSPDGFTPLGLASFFGHDAIVHYLLGAGAEPSLPSDNAFKVAPLHSACAISNYEIAAELLAFGADVNARQASGVTPLHSAAHNGQTKLAQLLIEHGADVNAKMDDGQTPLGMALEKKFTEVADLIREHGGVSD